MHAESSVLEDNLNTLERYSILSRHYAGKMQDGLQLPGTLWGGGGGTSWGGVV
jgi:hypothetical protein